MYAVQGDAIKVSSVYVFFFHAADRFGTEICGIMDQRKSLQPHSIIHSSSLLWNKRDSHSKQNVVSPQPTISLSKNTINGLKSKNINKIVQSKTSKLKSQSTRKQHSYRQYKTHKRQLSATIRAPRLHQKHYSKSSIHRSHSKPIFSAKTSPRKFTKSNQKRKKVLSQSKRSSPNLLSKHRKKSFKHSKKSMRKIHRIEQPKLLFESSNSTDDEKETQSVNIMLEKISQELDFQQKQFFKQTAECENLRKENQDCKQIIEKLLKQRKKIKSKNKFKNKTKAKSKKKPIKIDHVPKESYIKSQKKNDQHVSKSVLNMIGYLESTFNRLNSYIDAVEAKADQNHRFASKNVNFYDSNHLSQVDDRSSNGQRFQSHNPKMIQSNNPSQFTLGHDLLSASLTYVPNSISLDGVNINNNNNINNSLGASNDSQSTSTAVVKASNNQATSTIGDTSRYNYNFSLGTSYPTNVNFDSTRFGSVSSFPYSIYNSLLEYHENSQENSFGDCELESYPHLQHNSNYNCNNSTRNVETVGCTPSAGTAATATGTMFSKEGSIYDSDLTNAIADRLREIWDSRLDL